MAVKKCLKYLPYALNDDIKEVMYKIGVVSARFYPQVVGSGTSAYMTACTLARNGHEVTVITDASLQGSHRNCNFPFKVVYIKDLEAYATGKASMQSPGQELYLQIKALSPDILHVCNFMPMLQISIFSSLLKMPVVFMPHNTPVLGERAIGYYQVPEVDVALASFILKSGAFDRLIAGSKAYFESLTHLGADPEKTTEVYLGIDIDEVQKDSQQPKEALFLEYFADSLSPNDRYIILPSRITKQKGITDAIKALSIVNQTHEIKLLLTGMHNPFHSEYADEVNNLARELSLESKILKPIKTIPREVLPVFYKHAQITIVPSLYEGLGLAAIEAQALGVPVIASDTTGLDEVVTDGENGLLSPPANPEVLASRILTLLDDQGLRERLIQNGLKDVHKFDIVKHVAALEEIYKEIIENRNYE